ncbi:MAG: hypothetical protein ACLQNE_12940 [Thermoguttaceae bacterium]
MAEITPPACSVPTTRDFSGLLPFVLREEDLAQLHEALVEFAGSAVYTLVFANGLSRSCDLAGVKACEDDREHVIRSLHVSTPASAERFATLTFRDDDCESFEVHCSGPEADVLRLSDAIDGTLAKIRPWYGCVAKNSLWQLGSILAMAVLVLVTLLLLATSIMIRIGVLSTPRDLAVNDLAITANLIMGLAVSYAFILAMLEWFRIRLFPVGTLAFGYGRKRYLRMERWRRAVVTSLLAGILCGFAVLCLKIGVLMR